MKRLWIYPALLPILGMLSALMAIWQRGWTMALPSIFSGDVYLLGLLTFGIPAVLPAILLDLWRNKRRDIALEKLAHNLALHWAWLTFYAMLVVKFFWTLHWAFNSFTSFNLGYFDFLDFGSSEDLPYFVQPLFFLWAIERATARKPAPTPPFLWRRWKRSWTLTTEK